MSADTIYGFVSGTHETIAVDLPASAEWTEKVIKIQAGQYEVYEWSFTYQSLTGSTVYLNIGDAIAQLQPWSSTLTFDHSEEDLPDSD